MFENKLKTDSISEEVEKILKIDENMTTKKVASGEHEVHWNGEPTDYHIYNADKGLSGSGSNMYGIHDKSTGKHHMIGSLQKAKKTVDYWLKQKNKPVKESVSKKEEDETELNIIPEEELSPAQQKKKEEIVHSMKDKEGEFKTKYGKNWKNVIYATATKLALAKEELEESRSLDMDNNPFIQNDNTTSNPSSIPLENIKCVAKKSLKKLKDHLSGKTTSEEPTFGKNPWDPWSAKANIAEEDILDEDALLDRFLQTKGINPKTASKISKISHSKTGEFERWKMHHMSGGYLPKIPQKESVEFIHSKTKKNKKEIESRKNKHNIIGHVSGPGYHKEDKDDSMINTVELNVPLLIRLLELAREDVKSDADLHRIVEKLIDIRNKGVLTMDDYDFISNLKEHYMLEDTFQDAKAATQIVSPESQDRDPIESNKRNQLSKSARIIKSIYKKHKMVKEDLYDTDKEDKSVKSPAKKTNKKPTKDEDDHASIYGQKPKMETTKPEDSFGENKPEAAAILTGGKTLTGQKRDTIEIDPLLRGRPGTKDVTKKDDKKK